MILLRCVCAFAALVQHTLSKPLCNETDDIQDCVLQNYNKYMRPRSGFNAITVANLSLNLLSIDDVDLKRQTVTAGMYLVMSWRDNRLKWNGSDDSSINVDLVKIWRPDLILTSVSESLMFLNFENTLARISPEGIVTSYPYFKVSLGSEIDVTKYPFDSQAITFIFEDWSHSNKHVMFSIDEDYNPFNSLAASGEWEVVDFTVIQWNKSYSSGYYHRAGYSINIKRQSLYYVMNVLGPVIVVSLLNVLCFLLPVSSGDRVTLSISIFLALTVFLVSVNDSLPKTSQGVSICVTYIGSHMVGSALTIVMVVLIICVDNKRSYCAKKGVLSLPWNERQSLFSNGEDRLQFDEVLNNWLENNERLNNVLRGMPVSAKEGLQSKSEQKLKVLSNRLNTLCLWMGCLWNIVLLMILVVYGYS